MLCFEAMLRTANENMILAMTKQYTKAEVQARKSCGCTHTETPIHMTAPQHFACFRRALLIHFRFPNNYMLEYTSH